MKKLAERELKSYINEVADRLMTELSERNSKEYQGALSAAIIALEKLSKFYKYDR